MRSTFIIALALVFSPVTSFAADIMFEGYYRIELDGQHVGYLIQRYEFEPKTKKFMHVAFTRATFGATTVQESLKAVANDKFHPESYQYTSQEGDKLKAIDASFKGEIMDLKISDGKQVRPEKHKVPKKTFLSCFLIYMMMQNKLAPGDAFKYSAVAEEDGGSFWGKSLVDSKDGNKLKVLTQFKGDRFATTFVVEPDPSTPDKYTKADPILVEAPLKKLVVRLVATPSKATENQSVPNKTLVSLFGNIPTGKVNVLAGGSTN